MRVAALVMLLANTAHAGRGALFPPLEIEYGVAATAGDQPMRSQLLVGLSWASLWPKPTPVDISLGFIATFRGGDGAQTAARSTTQPPPQTEDADTTDVGMFVAFDRFLPTSSKHLRSWFGGRVEMLGRNDRGVLGAAARVGAELWAPAVVTSPQNGGIVGTIALSLWSEVGIREVGDGRAELLLLAGVGGRIPFVLIH